MKIQTVSITTAILLTLSIAASYLIPLMASASPLEAGAEGGTITYRLEWDWGRAEPSETGEGWQVVNDLGYGVQIQRGYLGNYSAELIPCDAHYVIGPSTETATNLPDEVDLDGLSLFVSEIYKSPGGDDAHPFELSTHLPDGTIVELTHARLSEGLELNVAAGENPIEVMVRRNLDQMFNGVDFASMSEMAFARTVLRSLTDATSIVVLEGDIHFHKTQ